MCIRFSVQLIFFPPFFFFWCKGSWVYHEVCVCERINQHVSVAHVLACVTISGFYLHV